MSFLQIDGAGSPESDEYARAVEALYALSYPVKFASKRLLDRDYVVCPLEGLWWSERLGSFAERSKAEWRWTMMIRQPGWVTADLVDSVREKAIAKAPAAAEVRFAAVHRGAQRADHAPRQLRGRDADRRAAARRVPARERPGRDRAPSRDLLLRPPHDRPRRSSSTLIRQPVARAASSDTRTSIAA